jgi:hypothetical protein
MVLHYYNCTNNVAHNSIAIYIILVYLMYVHIVSKIKILKIKNNTSSDMYVTVIYLLKRFSVFLTNKVTINTNIYINATSKYTV